MGRDKLFLTFPGLWSLTRAVYCIKTSLIASVQLSHCVTADSLRRPVVQQGRAAETFLIQLVGPSGRVKVGSVFSSSELTPRVG